MTVKELILQTLEHLRNYALGKGCEIVLFYHEEVSYLMRFANSAISLNTNEHLIRLDITAYASRKRASYELITDLSKIEEMKRGIDVAAEMVQHAQPLSYEPTVPVYAESFADESAYDEHLAHLSNEERLQYFNQAVAGLETAELKLSGIFSCGSNTIAQINTRSRHTQFFRTSDAQVTLVLAHTSLKWEVQAEQSAQKKAELDPRRLRADLAFLAAHYQHDTPQQIALGTYDIVFGPAAIAELVDILGWIAFNGGLMKRGYSFLTEEQVGHKVFSSRVSLIDDPRRPETFPFARDFTGITRLPYPIIEAGVFKGWMWNQDDADEFGAKPSGHTVAHKSLMLAPGDQNIPSLKALIDAPRERDTLYIPFLHYMNIVNPSKGIITASSRFGALLLRKDGAVTIPYNVRLTQSLLDIFGDQVAWLAQSTQPYNVSKSYGARNPAAILVPDFMQVNGLEISHSNTSY
jgi:predicted Zn-dependent protease